MIDVSKSVAAFEAFHELQKGGALTNEPELPVMNLHSEQSDPKFSVLIVNYNYARFLPEAIDSVLEQSYQNFEIVICDDGSEDDSPQVIAGYVQKDPLRIHPVFKKNGGVGSALNAAYRSARGEIIAILDADDRFAPEKLARVAEQFSSSDNVGLVVNRMVKFGSSGEMTGLIPQIGALDQGWIRDKMLRSGGHWSFAPASGISLSRRCADGVFPIPEQEFRTEADSYIFTQAPLFWEVRALSEPLSYYRLHTNNVTSSELIDARYADKIVDGIQRMNSALARTAKVNRLPVPSIGDNPTYAEMTFLRDYLDSAQRGRTFSNLFGFWRAAFRCQTADRLRWRLKPAVMTLIALLPVGIGSRLIQMIYLPTGTRQRLARIRLFWERRILLILSRTSNHT